MDALHDSMERADALLADARLWIQRLPLPACYAESAWRVHQRMMDVLAARDAAAKSVAELERVMRLLQTRLWRG